MSVRPAYFYSDSLKTRFARNIDEAVSASRISEGESLWLQCLLNEPAQPSEGSPRPRVDRLVLGNAPGYVAELAGALFITDPVDAEAPVFLSTLVFGIERFEGRSAVLDALRTRFDVCATPLVIDAERIEGPLFEAQSRMIMRQQSQHLEALWLRLHELPDLRAALGQALQAGQQVSGEQADMDVFSPCVQVVERLPSAGAVLSAVVGTQSPVDVAEDRFFSHPLPFGLTWKPLDGQGNALTQAQADLRMQTLSVDVVGASAAYEQSLLSYWTTQRQDGLTRREQSVHALAESFRQHLLSGRESGELNDDDYHCLRLLLPSHNPVTGLQSVRVHRLSAVVAEQEPVKLVGLFLIDFPQPAQAGVYLYSSFSGFRRFDTVAQLSAHLTNDQSRTELLFYSSLNDHNAVRTDGSVELYQDVISGAFFFEFINSVIALQMRNVRYVLGLPPIAHEKASVRIDDALDIRMLLDGRLARLHDAGRWRPEALPFDELWGALAAVTQTQPESRPEPADTWAGKLKKIESLLERLYPLRIGVEGCMRHALNRYLAQVSGPRLDARSLWVAQGRESESIEHLIALALARASGRVTTAFSSGSVFEGLLEPVTSQTVQRLPLPLLEQMLDCVLLDFPQRFEKQINDFYSRSIRHFDIRIRPYALSCMVREYALRLELYMEKRIGKLPLSVLHSVQQVLDRPVSALRLALGERRVEAFTVSVRHGTPEKTILVPNTFVLRSAHSPNAYIFWALGKGLLCFESLEALEHHIVSGLTGSEDSSYLQRLLAEPDRQALPGENLQQDTSIARLMLQQIDGHFIETLQRGEIDRQRRTCSDFYQQAVKWQLSPELFAHLMQAVERDDRNRQNLTNLGVAIQFVVYKAVVPVWISDASIADQITLINALRRFYVTCVGQKDFLFDIPSLYDYSLEQLGRRLNADFPEPRPNPENILVTLTHYVPAPVPPGQVPQSIPAATGTISENLAEFAVNRFMSRQDGIISLASQDGQPLPASLTPAYVRDLVESLDIAAGYRSMLESQLLETTPAYPERRRLYIEQMPSLELLRAIALKLKNELSEQACHFIEAVLTMPDALARLPVQGVKVMLSPLQLLPATEGWPPTVVLNTYLIGPVAPHAGPWVLYAPLHEEFVFKEYSDQTALLYDVRTSDTLQTYILDRIDPQQRKLYDNGGFMEPHLPFSVEASFDLPWERPLPVTLKVEPFEGNALEFLFRGSLDILKLQVSQQSTTNAEYRRNTSQYLFTLGAEQVMALLPGRLGALVGVLQSQTLFNLSVVSAGEQRWGKALSEFMAALSVMISSGQDPQALVAQEEAVGSWEDDAPQTPFYHDEQTRQVPTFTWDNGSLSQQVRTRLREFEVHDSALNTLQKDELMNTYNDPLTGKKYAAIDGKAYELHSDRDGWFIVGSDMTGPPVRLDIDQQWKIDMPSGLKGGGGLLTRMKDSIVDEEVDEILVVNARGMTEIRHSYRDMAQAIEEGHAQARSYLENCMSNLTLRTADDRMDPRVEKIIADFFGTRAPDVWLYDVIRQAVTDIYGALMDPSLSPVDSPRYVVGINRLGFEASSGFVFEGDPLKRIFLTEQFFRLPSYRLKVSAMRSGEFHFGAHYRGAILIHELSHLTLRTDDIAYLDSQAPFLDLLEDTAGYRMRIKNEQIAQQKSFGYETDRDQLFKQLEDDTLRDLKGDDGNAKRTILNITGKRTLDKARDVFYSDLRKRATLMLKNADSVALLLTLLGRRRFTTR
ncbi:dermonecrotic toxin domain-containing protein [Pseudomonas cannabina]|nr:DUF6543 domain-containing protein [Pseudomonas cannabina]